MIDFLIGVTAGALLTFAYFHFKGESPAKIVSDFTSLEMRIKTMITDALNDLLAAANAQKDKAVADAVAAAVQPAQAAQETADEQAVRDFTAQNFPPATP